MGVSRISVLLIEDDQDDVVLLKEALEEAAPGRFLVREAQSLSAALSVLDQKTDSGGTDSGGEPFAVILLDLNLPDASGEETVSTMCERQPELPIVVLTGIDDEAKAVSAVKLGAQDYLVKGEATGTLLTRSIAYAIERKAHEREQRGLIHDLTDALSKVKTLRGLLPICSNCKGIRDDKGYWTQLEQYLLEHSDADFTHSICPKCSEKLFAQAREIAAESVRRGTRTSGAGGA
ncbi:MAG TPA: response regulator [Blastocatellia bacterium]|nr:response regulator [Blastocatellia bacterium]